MTVGPTTGASEGRQRSWQASKFWARAVGAAVFLAPLVAAWAAVWRLRDYFYQPPGIAGIVLWILQSVVIASIVAGIVERIARRLLPLQVLLGMSLTFPDHAPSRFKVALRAGTIKRLSERIPDISSGGTASVQEAAEHAIQLVSRLGKHERLTRGHTERVRAFSDLIAVELGLSDEDRNKLAWAAMLHDIGKLAVPADILNKDSRPTDAEWAILASHPSEGLALLEPLHDWLGDWLLATSEHHERWDGGGYPNGLSGLDISLAGRIVAVADAYDVITSHRSYKDPLSLEAARNELVTCSGNQFDPTIVRAMLTASKSDKTGVAKLAGLLELRTISQAVSSVSTAPAAVAASIVAAPVVLGAPVVVNNESAAPNPAEVAFVEPSNEQFTNDQFPAGSVIVTTTISPPGAVTSATVSVQSTITAPAETGSTTTSAPSVGATTPTPGPATTATTTQSGSAPTAAPTSASVATTTTSPTTPTTTPSSSSSTTTTSTTTAPQDDCGLLRTGTTALPGADLVGCDISGLDLEGVDLQGADLTGADLRHATLTDFNLSNAKLTDAQIDGATFTDGQATRVMGLRLSASDVTLINVDFSNSTLPQSDFSDSDLMNVSFSNASLNDTDLSASQLDLVVFTGANLTGAEFSDVNADSTDFSDTNSQRVVFDDSDISQSSFSSATLTQASFVDTDASEVDLSDANLSRADLTRTDFDAATGVPIQSTNATFDDTVCPDGETHDSTCWP